MALARDEKLALKAACIQAAAILVAGLTAAPGFPRNEPFGTRGEPDTGNCARYARDLFGKLTGEPWE
jgi:hypothetical protein